MQNGQPREQERVALETGQVVLATQTDEPKINRASGGNASIDVAAAGSHPMEDVRGVNRRRECCEWRMLVVATKCVQPLVRHVPEALAFPLRGGRAQPEQLCADEARDSMQLVSQVVGIRIVRRGL